MQLNLYASGPGASFPCLSVLSLRGSGRPAPADWCEKRSRVREPKMEPHDWIHRQVGRFSPLSLHFIGSLQDDLSSLLLLSFSFLFFCSYCVCSCCRGLPTDRPMWSDESGLKECTKGSTHPPSPQWSWVGFIPLSPVGFLQVLGRRSETCGETTEEDQELRSYAKGLA